MAPHPTSLKLPQSLKRRLEHVASVAGKTPHAFMLEAIERETGRAEAYEAFIAEALEADREVEASGHHYPAEDVFQYLSARAEGRRARRPRPKPWRA